MAWTKLDDDFCMHPKVLMAGNAATGVFARCLSYCGCYLTDGLVPGGMATTIEGEDSGALDTLERVGLVQRLETGAVFIPDFLEFNPSKAQVEADRERRRANGSKGGRPSTKVVRS